MCLINIVCVISVASGSDLNPTF